MTRRRHAAFGLAFVLIAAAADATTMVPMSADQLADGAAAVVIGRVLQLEGVVTPAGNVVTLVKIAVEEVLKGDIASPAVTLKEDGGTVRGTSTVIFGAPQFSLGERVLLFLSARPDGSLRTSHMALGKFRLEDVAGEVRLSQQFGAGTTVLEAPDAGAPPATLRQLREAISRSVARSPRQAGGTYSTEPPEAHDPTLSRERTARFAVFDPAGRHFEPDEGQSLRFLVDARGDAIVGVPASHQAVEEALAAWNDVATASITAEVAGLTDDLSFGPGIYKIRFRDPEGAIDPPSGCSGVLGLGGFQASDIETKTLGGTVFRRASQAFVTIADGLEGCDRWDACALAEVLTHEVGHALGLDHSSEDPDEADAVRRDATMYFLVHFDGRCAGVRQDDTAGISSVYPTALPPTITSSDLLPFGVAGVPYQHSLQAVGGSSSLEWRLLDGGFPGLLLTSQGVIAGTPTAFGETFFRIEARDESGAAHTKTFHLTVLLPTDPTPTATLAPSASATPSPHSSPTRTATRTATATPTRTQTRVATETPTQIVGIPGDANCDSQLDGVDIVAAVANLFVADPFARCTGGDCNDDDAATAADLPCIIRKLAASGNARAAGKLSTN